jgi:NADH pyrophosphatase NudC (nudix superfamily)
MADRAYAPANQDDDEATLVDTTGENPVPFIAPSAFIEQERAEPSSTSGHQCEYCGGVLPANREARFCPHCGQPQEGELKCQGCGNELDVGWAYCLSCGRATGFE